MSLKFTHRTAPGTALVLGVALIAAPTTVASAASRHHKARHHVSSKAQGSYASAPASDPFANDPTMYAVQHHIPVPDKTSPGIYPVSPGR